MSIERFGKNISNNKILIITECFYPEEFKINDIAFSWQDKGYDVTVLTLFPTYPIGKVFNGYKNRLFYKETVKEVSVIRLWAITGYKDSFLKKILKYCNFMILGSMVSIFIGRRYDYIFGFNMGALTSMVPSVIVRKLYKKPLVFWSQDLWPDSVYAYGIKKSKTLSYFLHMFVKYIYRSPNFIAITSKGFESKLSKYISNKTIIGYMPNWADDINMSVEPITLSSEDLIQITFAGNIGKVQNLENVIKAFCTLPGEIQAKAQLNIIGDGSNLNNLKLLFQGNKKIIFHGKKNRLDMAKYYQASDFLVVSLIDRPIFSITVPAKIQTYIAAKKPILGFINGDAAELIHDNNLGLCSGPSDIANIAEIYLRCIEMNPAERESFTFKNDFLLQEIFNKERTINSLLEALISSNNN